MSDKVELIRSEKEMHQSPAEFPGDPQLAEHFLFNEQKKATSIR